MGIGHSIPFPPFHCPFHSFPLFHLKIISIPIYHPSTISFFLSFSLSFFLVHCSTETVIIKNQIQGWETRCRLHLSARHYPLPGSDLVHIRLPAAAIALIIQYASFSPVWPAAGVHEEARSGDDL